MLTSEQLEAIGILQEELAELIQALSKIRRSGLEFCPFNGSKSNLDIAYEELCDVNLLSKITFELLGPSSNFDVKSYEMLKLDKLRRWSSLKI